jgi:TetR/AcrR family transcriptional regulator, cholesterol catabolism regulator
LGTARQSGVRTISRLNAQADEVTSERNEPVRSGGAARDILDAGAWLLRHRGYEATTTRAIADRVGIKAGSIYHHFPSKDHIVQQVLDEGVRVVLRDVSAALASLPNDAAPLDRLQAAIKAHLLSSLENSDYTSASIRAFAFLPEQLRRNCRVERRRYEQIWQGLILEAANAGLIPQGVSLDAARLLLLGAVNWAGEWYRPGRLAIDDIARSFAMVAIGSATSGVGKPEPSKRTERNRSKPLKTRAKTPKRHR